MRINLNPPADATAKNESTTFLMIRFAITYSVFFISLSLWTGILTETTEKRMIRTRMMGFSVVSEERLTTEKVK